MTRFDFALTLLSLSVALASACSDDDSSATTDSGDSTSGGSATTAAPTTNPPNTSDSTGGSGESGSATGTATGPGGQACGEVMCGEGEYCDYGGNGCGDFEFDRATCMPLPEACDEIYQPVCGCDGQLYDNPCTANAAGVDIGGFEQCTTPDGYFPCGYLFCTIDTTYCQVSVSDIGGVPGGFSCLPPSEPCADQLDCDCLMMEPCADFSCEATPEGGIEIVCPGG